MQSKYEPVKMEEAKEEQPPNEQDETYHNSNYRHGTSTSIKSALCISPTRSNSCNFIISLIFYILVIFGLMHIRNILEEFRDDSNLRSQIQALRSSNIEIFKRDEKILSELHLLNEYIKDRDSDTTVYGNDSFKRDKQILSKLHQINANIQDEDPTATAISITEESGTNPLPSKFLTAEPSLSPTIDESKKFEGLSGIALEVAQKCTQPSTRREDEPDFGLDRKSERGTSIKHVLQLKFDHGFRKQWANPPQEKELICERREYFFTEDIMFDERGSLIVSDVSACQQPEMSHAHLDCKQGIITGDIQPYIIIVFNQPQDVNHMITELPRAVGHVWKCQHIADYLGMKLFEDVGCWPIAMHEWEGRGKTGHPFSKEHPQFKSSLTFQRKLFGRSYSRFYDPIPTGRFLGIVGVDKKFRDKDLWNDHMVQDWTPWETIPWLAEPRRRYKDIKAKWHYKCGPSTDVAVYPTYTKVIQLMRKRLMKGVPQGLGTRKQITIVQRDNCPCKTHPKCQFGSIHSNRCLHNIDEIKSEIEKRGFQVDIIQFGSKKGGWHVDEVMAMLDNTTIFMGVEGNTLGHVLWLDPKKSGLIALFPRRDAECLNNYHNMIERGTTNWVPLYPSILSEQVDMCISNYHGPDVRQEGRAGMFSAKALANAAQQMYERLLDGTCETCLINKDGMCTNLKYNRR